MAAVSLSVYQFLWRHQSDAADLLEKTGLVTWFDTEKFIEEVTEAAKNYKVPESEDDEEGKRAIEPFLEQFTDEYTGISIYGMEDGLYRWGRAPDILTKFVFGSLLASSQTILGEEHGEYPVEFANGTYNMVYYSYSKNRFTYPYVIMCVLLCVIVFFSGILIFVRRMIKRISCVKDSIVSMSAGDLRSPVPDCGKDEIGIVAEELDALRKVFQENIQRESESRQANQDLITAISHDLRTPLTVLNGYLEVLRLKKTPPSMQEEYIERCLKKAEDIKVLTDRMFEYALVYEEDETLELREIPLSLLIDCVKENCDFIRIAGFDVSEDIAQADAFMYGDEVMLKRIFSNLFSNILKYGDKKGKVEVKVYPECGQIRIMLVNQIKENTDETESNQIGLRSVKKMVDMHQGELYTFVATNIYSVRIAFDIVHKYSSMDK